MPDTGITNWPLDTDDLNLPSDMDTRAPTSAGDGHYTFKQWMERGTGMLRAIAHDLLTAMTHDLPMGGFRITGLPTPSASTEPLIKSQLDTDGTLAANSDTRVATQKAVKTYADALIAAADAMVFKGVIDCSSNPNYPAADRGWTYRVSVAGKIGGASGTNAEVGDLLLCLTDGTASGTQAAVGANWEIAQANIDGAVTGPASSTDNAVALFNGTTGKVVKDSGVILGALASKSTVASADITDGTIVDADISGSAAIADAKLALTTVEKTANKGANSGYMGLDSSGNGAQPPKLHGLHGSRHTDYFKPTEALRETFSRVFHMTEIVMLSSGQETMFGIELAAGDHIAAIAFFSGSSGGSGMTHQFFTLRDSSLNLLGVTSDDTSTAWAANSKKKLSLAVAYDVAASGLYYVGAVVVGTRPNFLVMARPGSGYSDTLAPAIAGADTTHTGLTTPATAPATSAALSAFGGIAYAYVSSS